MNLSMNSKLVAVSSCSFCASMCNHRLFSFTHANDDCSSSFAWNRLTSTVSIHAAAAAICSSNAAWSSCLGCW